MNHRLVRFVAPVVAGAGLAAIVLASATSGVGASAVHPSASTGASGSSTSTTLVKAPPIQNRHRKQIFVYFDTVTGGGSPKPAAACAITNIFQQGQLVVFRMWGVDVAAGGTPLTDANVKTAFVTIPGIPKIQLTYGKHPSGVAFWSAPWSTANYPLGVVNFTITVKTKAMKASGTKSAAPSFTGVFSEQGMPTPSQLTIVAA
jgi:hypothetical protein